MPFSDDQWQRINNQSQGTHEILARRWRLFWTLGQTQRFLILQGDPQVLRTMLCRKSKHKTHPIPNGAAERTWWLSHVFNMAQELVHPRCRVPLLADGETGTNLSLVYTYPFSIAFFSFENAFFRLSVFMISFSTRKILKTILNGTFVSDF